MSSNSTTLLPSESKASKTISQLTLIGCGNLLRLLPGGTLIIFQLLNSVLTNNGKCQTIHKYLSIILIVACSLSCFFTSFTDSYVDNQGNVQYGIVTTKGLWPNSKTKDLSSYRLCVGDFMHAFLALSVFVVIALLNPDVVECFYSNFKSTQKALLMTLPPVIGVVSSSIFVLFPNTRHGIGHPRSETSGSSTSTLA